MLLPGFYTIELNKTPTSEVSKKFLQGMADRMGVSFHKYGAAKLAYPDKVNAIESLEVRLQKYKEDGNTEWLMDVANFAMLEFMHPAHPNAHYEPQDSDTSPGRITSNGTSSSKRNESL